MPPPNPARRVLTVLFRIQARAGGVCEGGAGRVWNQKVDLSLMVKSVEMEIRLQQPNTTTAVLVRAGEVKKNGIYSAIIAC